MAQEYRDEVKIAEQHSQVELTEGELELVAAAGGRVDPGGANN